ncbi:CDP-alcohol phosphatidyltransferase family protein [Jannaschia pohangensis]|uniref:Phosphatidylglycerophosphate synthase n=1 Tax=Jannaschia pohangensis TaxID=390807 RepID=A0A1I3NXV5_9RHOB|nr:CDP-alcohol phosphatidyltransferase family protein [Jannaschia pohangensis]SFJ13942.1 Phosphatidylglycerophosphate synthase [Jannaschia pohangensis]
MTNDILPLPKAQGMPRPSVSRAQVQGGVLWLILGCLVFVLSGPFDPLSGSLAAALATGLFGLSGAVALWAMGPLGYPHRTFGAPNSITFLRLALLCVLSVALLRAGMLTQMGYAVFGIAVLALSLDGLDGWLARRNGLSTAFGARFDMEVDAALACMLSLILLMAGRVGIEVLILGFSRYAFLLAGIWLTWLRAPLPERFGRKVVCVLQIGALCVLVLPGLPPLLAKVISLGAAGLLTWSFGRDVLYLAARR